MGPAITVEFYCGSVGSLGEVPGEGRGLLRQEEREVRANVETRA